MNKVPVIIIPNTPPLDLVANLRSILVDTVDSGACTQLKLVQLSSAVGNDNGVTSDVVDLAAVCDETLVVGALEVAAEGVVCDQTVAVGQLHVALVWSAVGLGPLVGENVVAVKVHWASDVLVHLHEVCVGVDAVETVEETLELGWVECVHQIV